MSEEKVRANIAYLIDDLRHSLQEIGHDSEGETNAVSDTRDRLRYIAQLTEQAAGRTLQAAEHIGDRLRAQQAAIADLPYNELPAPAQQFLTSLYEQHQQSLNEVRDVMQAQEFQDLVGQVINKLLVTVERMESSLVHLLIDEEESTGLMNGPQIDSAEKVSQSDVDSLFD